MKRLASMLLLTLVLTALGTPGAAGDRTEVRIQHLDGSGTETIVDVHPGIPGTEAFVRATPAVVPQPGEIIVQPSETSTPTPASTPARPPLD